MSEALFNQRELTRLILQTDGRLEALRFAYEHRDNAHAIRNRLDESEEFLTDESMLNGPMKLGADPRTYRDAYIAALREVLQLIEPNSTDKP